ncbi:MAG: hypothetical protein M0Q88_05325 [Bacilli bacterium]|nr:hypothetical protein [Bacilli bacterium]
MIKNAIGIIDSGVEGFNILDTLTKKFKHENFIYINDLKHYPYFNMTETEALEVIKSNVERLMDLEVKLILVVSDVIVDLAKDYFASLSVPVFDVVSLLIDYINENYEQKNIALFGLNEVLEANLYQKNFKYNRLYNIPSNELEELIMNKGLKTSKSFLKTKETFKQLKGKGLDVIIASSPYLILLKTEIEEFLSFNEITDFGEIVANKIHNEFMDLNIKGRGKVTVLGNIDKSKFFHMTSWTTFKYKYNDLDKKNRKQKLKKFKQISNQQK